MGAVFIVLGRQTAFHLAEAVEVAKPVFIK